MHRHKFFQAVKKFLSDCVEKSTKCPTDRDMHIFNTNQQIEGALQMYIKDHPRKGVFDD